MDLSIVIPYRYTEGLREDNFQFIKKYYQSKFPKSEIVLGLDDGKGDFKRSHAINNGVRKSKGDAILINDADIFISKEAIMKGIKLLKESPFIIPWGRCLDLTREKCRELLIRGPPENLEELNKHHWFIRDIRPGNTTFVYEKCAGGIQLITKSFFKEIGGYDERFKKAGFEDTEFCLRIQHSLGDYSLFEDECCYHLFHERQAVNYFDNQALFKELIKKFD